MAREGRQRSNRSTADEIWKTQAGTRWGKGISSVVSREEQDGEWGGRV